ncbi:MAG: HAD-IIIA family hydrolase [Gluconacetobacter diazotrophicus]|nr:HAD-IIIA family hydrolase [Gluconacetobacter diazotrophicus]
MPPGPPAPVPVTVRQCAILVGGLGSRLGALAADTPKPLMPIGGRPFLFWLMREMQRWGVEEFVLLAGHLSPAIAAAADALPALLPRPARIRVSVEPHRAGTGGAVRHALPLLDERFWLCNGDSLLDCDLSAALATAPDASGDAPPDTATIVLRALDDTGRYGTVSLDGDRVSAFHAEPRPGAPGLINAGLYILPRTLVADFPATASLEADLLPRLAAAGRLRGVVGEGYFRDIGIPVDLERARTEIPARLRRPALFLDRDGVINRDHGWVGTRERFEWTPDGRDAVRLATRAGHHVFVVTNQSGIARGLYSEEQLDDLHRWMTDEIRRHGGTIDDLRFCPFHPDAPLERYRRASADRKPQPGMILDLLRRWELDPARCALIGDQPTDLAAATAAGIRSRRSHGGDLLPLLSDLGIIPRPEPVTS